MTELFASVAAGNVWVTSDSNATINGTQFQKVLSTFSNSGSPISPTSGYAIFPGTSQQFYGGIAIDNNGDGWIATDTCPSDDSCVVKMSLSGAVLSGTGGYSGGGIDFPIGIAIDGNEIIGIATPVVTPLATGVLNNTPGTRP